MTVQDVTAIVGALGFPIVLVAGLLWFFAQKVWPWYVARQAANDAAQAEREKSHSAQVAQTRDVYERMIAALDRIASRTEAQHAEVMREIHALRPRSHLEPDRDR